VRDGFELTRFVLVCLGGAAGTGARYLVALGAPLLLGPTFPWGTLTVNVVGSLLLGLVMQVGLTSDLLSPTARITLATGVLGASRPIRPSTTRRCASANRAPGAARSRTSA